LSAIVGLETRSDTIRPFSTLLIYPAVDATWSQPSIRTNGSRYFLTQDCLSWYLDHYIGRDDSLRNNPRVSPLHEPDLKGAPRTLVAVAGFDPLVDEGVLYAKRLGEAGVNVDLLHYRSLIHGFILMTQASRAALHAADEIAKRAGEILRGD